ncbi:MAG: energy transducer TonB [Flavobacteriaceae bacterium]|nr:energy transducer TonB [Flavobacteriaceae bacterium]
MINYIIQVLLFQTVFLAVYDLILKKETFFQWNRAYLIVTSILAYIIPLIRFTSASESIPQEYRIMLPEVMLSPETFIEKQVESSAILFSGMQWVFIIGVVIAGLLFASKLYQIFKLIRQNSKEKNKDYHLILLPSQHTAFSFFHYIFLGKTARQKEEIIQHELIHVKQKHSIDLLFFEAQKILLWFNPYSYLYQNRIAEIHEFIADAKTVHKKEKSTFYQTLLAETFKVDKLAFVNAFNKQSIIKKRIIMFSKEKSKEILKFKYVLMIPVLMGMLLYTSCENTEPDKALSKINQKRFIKFITEGYTKNDGTHIEKRVVQTEIEGYFDLYNGLNPGGNEISISDLTNEEKAEYLESIMMRKDKSATDLKIIEFENGNRMIQQIIDFRERDKYKKSKDYSNADVVPFAHIDQVPIFPGCEDATDQKKCMVKKITKFVGSNFNTSLSKSLGLAKGKKRVYVQFKIDKTGDIVDVKARGPHKDLETEAIRVISSLPQMQPGEENGKKVAVKYTLPITLVVE